MNRKLFDKTLLAAAFAAFIAVPSLSVAEAQDLDKQIDEAVAAMEHAGVDQKDEAAHKAKVTLDGVSEQVKQIEDRMNDEWQDMNQFARQSAGATLNKLHDQRDRLSQRYHDLADSSAAQWESAKKSFLDAYHQLHQTISDAELDL